MAEKLVYKFNPYTYARISAMKSLLLKKEDYDRVMKMHSSEIVKFMQEGDYAKEINELSIKYSGVKLVENALNKHLERVFLKLKLISDPNIEYLMLQYLKRYDFWNLKTLIRAKTVEKDLEKVMDMLIPVGSLKLDKLRVLYSKNTVREIIEESGLINAREFEDAINNYESTKDLSEIENLFDYHYYQDSVEFASKIPEQGKLFQEFFKYEFDVYNIMLLLKKIFFNLSKQSVEKYIINDGKNLPKRIVLNLLNKENIQSFMRELSKTNYGKILPEPEKDEQGVLLKYEILLQRFLLKKSVLLYHQHPLTVDLVLGFMFAKEIEVSNLRTIIKSKYLEFTEDYVKKLIVVKK